MIPPAPPEVNSTSIGGIDVLQPNIHHDGMARSKQPSRNVTVANTWQNIGADLSWSTVHSAQKRGVYPLPVLDWDAVGSSKSLYRLGLPKMAATNGTSSDSENERSLAGSEHQTTSSMSSATSPALGTRDPVQKPDSRLFGELSSLYTETVAAKIWRVAQELLEKDVSLASVLIWPDHLKECAWRVVRRRGQRLT